MFNVVEKRASGNEATTATCLFFKVILWKIEKYVQNHRVSRVCNKHMSLTFQVICTKEVNCSAIVSSIKLYEGLM